MDNSAEASMEATQCDQTASAETMAEHDISYTTATAEEANGSTNFQDAAFSTQNGAEDLHQQHEQQLVESEQQQQEQEHAQPHQDDDHEQEGEGYGGMPFVCHQPLHPYDDLENRDYSQDETYKKLIAYGIAPLVAAEVMEIFNAGITTPDTMEERTLDFIKNIQPELGRFVLNEFRKSNLMGISNASSYLGSLIKNFKDRVKLLGHDGAITTPVVFGPTKEKLEALLERKNYRLEVTIGQRKYGGPPPGYDSETPPPGATEVYIGKIPKEIYEDELVPIFDQVGDLFDFRIMMDPVTNQSKGYAFATYLNKQEAVKAANKYDGYEIRPGKKIRCNVSIANTRLFVGNIPKPKSKEEILNEFQTIAELEGLLDVIIYPSSEDPERLKNRGFAFLDFNDHKNASTAKRRLSSGRMKIFNRDLVIDWAEPQDEVDEETMAQVKAIYIRNLRENITEEMIKECFSAFGEIEKIKKLKDYCFVHYTERDNALKAIQELNGREWNECRLEITLARPMVERRNKPRYRGGGGYGGGMRGMRGGGSYGNYGAPPMYGYGPSAMMDPYSAAAYGSYGAPYEYSYGTPYGFGGGPMMGGYGGPQGSMGYGGPRGGRGGGRGGRGGGGFYGSQQSSYGMRGGLSPGGRGGGFRGGNRGGAPLKRSLPTGATNSSPKRKNDGSQDWSAD